MDALARLHAQPFSTRQALGVVTPDQLRGPRYRRLMRGAHQTADADTGHGRQIQAFRVTHPHAFVLLGHSAAWAHGATFAAGTDPVVVSVPSSHQLRRTAAVHPHVGRLDPDDVVLTPLGPATRLGRTAFDLARGTGSSSTDVDDRVVEVDALLRSTPLGLEAARAVLDGAAGLRGVRRAREVLGLAREGVDSPPETRLRLLLVRAGLPDPVTQCPVEDRWGRTVARLDLGWPDLRLGCEYDGEVHLGARQVRVDLRRHNDIREAGWVVLQVDRHQMRRPDEIVRQVLSLVAARRRST
ncbi:hypothetical protein [Aquipuribacter hungaricus]|uniref:Endonuclease domain-containing protein n=1 Tax=Aquipuribacter hungaricus TaxID=545624 RepID=A0ABV7WEG6_9MICO